MPELPEVENIVKGLKKLLKNSIINFVIINEPSLVAFPNINRFSQELKNKKILDISRRGKYILIHLSKNKILVIHLRMTGKLLYKSEKEPVDKHTHIIFKLNNENDLRFNNIRKFGRMYLIDSDDFNKAGGLSELGPEPLDDDFSFADFKKLFKGRTASIKSLLLNQKFIAGLGNIYTDEVLFRSGIHPTEKANNLSCKDKRKLYNNIRKILKLGIKYHGTTFSDYVNAFGEKGSFQEKLKVYQNEGKKCPKCRAIIKKEKVAGRSSYFCPSCQNNKS